LARTGSNLGAASQTFSSDQMPGQGGQWTFHVINEGTSGNYSVTWQSTTSP